MFRPTLVLALICMVAGVSASAQKLSGRQVFAETCSVCHARGVAGAPTFGNHAAWRKHLAKGISVLDDHAIHGYYGYSFMPPKGGNESLSDNEIRAAVRFMVAAATRPTAKPLDPHQ